MSALASTVVVVLPLGLKTEYLLKLAGNSPRDLAKADVLRGTLILTTDRFLAYEHSIIYLLRGQKQME
jgi:hypothetical protein